MSSACASCGEPLLWVENVATGKRLPLVAKPNRVKLDQLKPGMVVVDPSKRKGKILTLNVIAHGGDRLRAAVDEERVHLSHFQDCPAGADWVGRKRSGR